MTTKRVDGDGGKKSYTSWYMVTECGGYGEGEDLSRLVYQRLQCRVVYCVFTSRDM